MSKHPHESFGGHRTTMNTYNFYDSLAMGKSGEESFFQFIKQNYPETKIEHLSNSKDESLKKGSDFLIYKIKIELKSPRWPLATLFIETVSNMNKGTVGALAKSVLDGSEYYIFWDSSAKDLAIYKSLELLRYVYDNLEGRDPKYAPNDYYDTEGYIFTREELKHLECELTSSGILRPTG